MKKLTLIVLALSALGILMAGCTPAAEPAKDTAGGATAGADGAKDATKEEGK